MNKKWVDMTIKKRILLISSVVLILAVFVLITVYVNRIISFKQDAKWMYCAEYEQYADDFNLVKDYIATEFSNEDDKYVGVSYNKEKGIRIFDPGIMGYLTLPDDVALSLDTISRNAFPHKDSNFDVIRVQKGRISFCIENGQYALVYSPEEKPTWVNSPDEDARVEVKKIQDGWYHVVKKD